MKATIQPCPSPTGRNNERLYLIKAPRGIDPKLALDAALKRRADDRDDKRHADDYDRRRSSHDEEERDLYELRRKLEHHLAQCLSNEAYHSALDILDEHLPGGQTYGQIEDEEAEEPDRERMREYLESKGTDESIISDVLEAMLRNAHEGGVGGKTDDRRRGVRDRKMAADAALTRFHEFYPWAVCIKQAV
jgi:hypothetical protein